MQTARDITGYRRHWAERFGTAPFLPMSRAEMDILGWDSCDVIIVSGDAYVDHPSFGMAIIGRVLEAQGFRVGIIAQPDWHSADAFAALGPPNLFFGITAGNMDSMVNRYTADRRVRSDDAYTPGGVAGKRPDRSVIVYAQRAREAFGEVPIVIGGIEASLRRIAHFDYWSEKVRRSVLLDAKADLLVYGNGERQICELAHRLAGGESIHDITDVRGTVFARRGMPADWIEIDSTHLDAPGPLNAPLDPYAMAASAPAAPGAPPSAPCRDAPAVPGGEKIVRFVRRVKNADRERSVIRMPAWEAVAADPVLYAHASRILHLESNPGNARALVQRHGDTEVWLNPPPIPLTTAEMDCVYESACRRPSCVYPGICPNLDTDHAPLIRLYRRARALPGIKKVLIASGVRYDLAVESPEYVKELAQHHTGGYLKIAPEALAEGPLSKMMKPGVAAYDRFKELFDRYSRQAGKEQYLIPYFIAAHPGTSDADMLELALWLKKNGLRADQVQAFLPTPMATATAMYHSGKNPLRRITRSSEEVLIPKGLKVRRLHKAFLRYHDANNWPLLREALRRMGRADLIGNGRQQLVPAYQPIGTADAQAGRRGAPLRPFRTQHTGLPHAPRLPRNRRDPGLS